jgi:hypothetical protein
MAFAIPAPYLYLSPSVGEASEREAVGAFPGDEDPRVAGQLLQQPRPLEIARRLGRRASRCVRERPSVSDIFDEVDEAVRREQFIKLWERYGYLMIAVAVLIVVGVALWRGYDYWQTKKAADLGAQFTSAAILAEEGKHQEAEQAFARIAAQGTAGYRVLARLREAAELAQRDPKAAVAIYDELSASSATAQPLRDLAALRAAMLLSDTAPFAELSRRLEPLAAAGAPFRHTARELLAFAAWKAGDTAAVQKWSQLIREDPDTPPALRDRIDILTAVAGEDRKS